MKRYFVIAMLLLGGALITTSGIASASGQGKSSGLSSSKEARDASANFATATPIKHVVVIYGENVSFDHYFGTYPYAQNNPGEPQFNALPNTPTVNGLYNSVGPTGPTGPLLTNNPTMAPPGGNGNPLRLSPSQAMTCDQNHGYTAEQLAVDHGAMDNSINETGRSRTLASCLNGLTTNGTPEPIPTSASTNYAVMDYYDGNTVTALWNYAQHFSMSDNSFGTNYGPSTDGALNVTSANTYGVVCGPSFSTINAAPCTSNGATSTSPLSQINPALPQSQIQSSFDATGTASFSNASFNTTVGTGTDISDTDPYYDVCSYMPSSLGGDGNTAATTIAMSGGNIGTDLNSKGITWGWFEGGFDDGYVPGRGMAQPTIGQICSESHQNVGGSTVTDYIPHHEPFQYYAATANPYHLPPTSVSMVGRSDQANHQYDMADFWAAADQGNLPAVSYLKAPAYSDGHAGYSDPLDEQRFVVDTINHLESLPTWSSTAVIINYDDSDGWYDHVLAPLLTQSQSASVDMLTATGTCGTNTSAIPLSSTGALEQGKCGLGPRLPLMVISPYAKSNFVDNTLTDQSSIVKFIEYNWSLPGLGNGAADASAGSLLSMFNFNQRPAPRVFLNPTTGEVTSIGYGYGQDPQSQHRIVR